MKPHTSGGSDTGQGAFCTTHWTVILQTSCPNAETSRGAFERIYLDYWYPLYAFARRRGLLPAEAEDITQGFFLHLIQAQSLEGMTREGGKFRSFLLRSLNNYLANDWDRRHAQKRGAGQQPLSLNAAEGESKYSLEPSDRDTPETIFERQWVLTLLANVLERLRIECETSGKGRLFADLHLHLQGDRQGPRYVEVAERHGMSEGAVKVAVHRLRLRYGEMLRDEIARTVSSPGEVDDELRHLIAVITR